MRLWLGDQEYAAFRSGYDRPIFRGLRVNTLKCPAGLREEWLKLGDPMPFDVNGVYVDSGYKAGSDPLHHAGAYYMQEPSAAAPVTVLVPRAGERILDVCAAPGGKSGQIGAALRGEGLLWSNDCVPGRARVLLENLQRLGVRNAMVSSLSAETLCHRMAGFFDAVLVDAPCSGEGMFRKEEAAVKQWSPGLIRQCARTGGKILDAAAEAVAPGGRLVYSTCTFAPEENEAQILCFLAAHPEFTLQSIDVPFGRPGWETERVARFLPDVPRCAETSLCRRIYPCDGGEGQFIALLRKQGDSSAFRAALPPDTADEEMPEVRRMLERCLVRPPSGLLRRAGEEVRLLPAPLAVATGLPLLAAGVTVGTLARNRIEPHHALFASSSPADCRSVISLSRDDPRTLSFLRGEELSCSLEPGYTAVAVEGICCGFGKVSSGRLKNRYPKALRLHR